LNILSNSRSEDNNIPEHVGIILDGNRRWAKQRGLPVVQGHSRGADVYEEIAEYAIECGVKYLSVYVFFCRELEAHRRRGQFFDGFGGETR
jgi:undecaprenyl diphosphate synthase